MIWHTVIQYYGADWLGMFLSVLNIWLMGNKNKYGFLVGILANLSWLIFGIMSETIAGLIVNLIMIILNFRGYQKWKKDIK